MFLPVLLCVYPSTYLTRSMAGSIEPSADLVKGSPHFGVPPSKYSESLGMQGPLCMAPCAQSRTCVSVLSALHVGSTRRLQELLDSGLWDSGSRKVAEKWTAYTVQHVFLT